jgi:hypothetical protein
MAKSGVSIRTERWRRPPSGTTLSGSANSTGTGGQSSWSPPVPRHLDHGDGRDHRLGHLGGTGPRQPLGDRGVLVSLGKHGEVHPIVADGFLIVGLRQGEARHPHPNHQSFSCGFPELSVQVGPPGPAEVLGGERPPVVRSLGPCPLGPIHQEKDRPGTPCQHQRHRQGPAVRGFSTGIGQRQDHARVPCRIHDLSIHFPPVSLSATEPTDVSFRPIEAIASAVLGLSYPSLGRL